MNQNLDHLSREELISRSDMMEKALRDILKNAVDGKEDCELWQGAEYRYQLLEDRRGKIEAIAKRAVIAAEVS